METLKSKFGLKYTKHISVVGGFCMLLLPMVVLADSCTYEEELNFTLPTSAIAQLDLKAGAGSLYITGEANTDEISVVAHVCSSRKSGLEGMGVEHVVRGDTQYLWTEIPEQRGVFWTSNNTYIDLEIVIPEGFDLRVQDGSGVIDIRGAGNLALDDGSGDARLFGITGDVKVDDGSGNLTIQEVAGNVSVDDGSGSLLIEQVQGSVDVDDGSGRLKIHNVLGVVTIRDGSGDIDVREVGEELRIVEAGSGNVRVDGRRGYPEVSSARL